MTQFGHLTRGELRDELKDRGLLVSGLKHELIERLEVHEQTFSERPKEGKAKRETVEREAVSPRGAEGELSREKSEASASGAGEKEWEAPMEMETRLAAFAAFSALAISIACAVWGDGLTAGNLASLHVSLAGIFVAARAVNRRPRGWQAHVGQALAIMALTVVSSEALRQQQPVVESDHSSSRCCEMDHEHDFFSLAANPFEGGQESGGDGGSIGVVAALEEWAIGAVNSLKAGDWRSRTFSVISFWGWASVAAYVALVEALPGLLRPFHPLFRAAERSHNVLLCLTSFAMLVGILWSSVTSGKAASVHDMLCAPFDETDPVFLVTSRTFFWSKAWEWLDTAILVAKGKPVSWIHYTHHASTTIATSLNMVPDASAIWSVVCASNSFVHTWMYGYYAMPRFLPLRQSRRWLTRAQILQHVSVLSTALYALYQRLLSPGECHNNTTALYIGLSMYLMYLINFSIFYWRSYLKKAKTKPQHRQSQSQSAKDAGNAAPQQ